MQKDKELCNSDVVLNTGSWSQGASRTKMKVLVLYIWSSSWSQSWRKSLAVFQDFCCNSWRQWARHTMAFCEDNKSSLPLFERTFCAPCTSASVERVFNNGGYLLGHTDASKAQCIDCGKLLSLGKNKPGKQTVHRLKCHLEKCHKDILYTVHEEIGIPSTRTTCKKAKLDEVLAVHYRADLVTECMKKNINIIRWLSFSPENECPFSFLVVNGISFLSAFSFTSENEKCFSVGL